MPVPHPRPGLFHWRWPILSVSATAFLALSGCRKPEIKTYVAPKDEPEKVAPVNSELSTALPKLTWKLPADWKEIGGDKMNAARFNAPGGVSIMVTPLALMSGQEATLVNMWRQMINQPLLSEEDAARAVVSVPIGNGAGQMFEISGKDEGKDITVITAFQHRDTRSWFFKLQGPAPAVAATRPAFLEFLKSIGFEAATTVPSLHPAPKAPDAAPAPGPVAPAPSPSPAPAPDASAVPGPPPASWKVLAPGAMQAAKFTVPEKEGATAEVSVSIFNSDTGGTAANVRRWRGQLALPDTDDAAIMALTKPLEGAPAGSLTVDLENQGRALTGAIVQRAGNWYFYKLTGGAAAVAAARADFINFCKAGS